MIDKNKIEEAKEEIYEDRFLLNGEEIVFNNDEKEEMFYEGDIKEAIGLGAKWATNEFLKDLWHPASEVPDKDRIYSHILYEIDGGYDLNGFNTKMIPIGENWTSFVENEHINRWLYIVDLFPKEGGEQ